MSEIKGVQCFFKSTQQLIGFKPGTKEPVTIGLDVGCPQTSHDSPIADVNGQTKLGCPYFHDELKKCRINMAISYGSLMFEKEMENRP